MALSKDFLLSRGKCCHHRCKNCPYSLKAVKEALSEIVHKKCIDKWLKEYNSSLRAIPLDLIESGQYNEIYDMIKQLESGEPRS